MITEIKFILCTTKMQLKPVAVFLAGLSSVLGHPAPGSRQADGCDAVHVFLARGTNEDYPGRQINVVNTVCDGVNSCGYEDIIYPASFLPDYCTSVGNGVVNGTSQITAYAVKCPNAQLVLSGYSQASIYYGFIYQKYALLTTIYRVLKLLAISSEVSLGVPPAVPSRSLPDWTLHRRRQFKVGSGAVNMVLSMLTIPEVAAVALFGDVTHVANQTYNVESGAAFNGVSAIFHPLTSR